MIKVQLWKIWKRQELILGHRLTYAELADATGLSTTTLLGLDKERTTRFDAHVLDALCEFFHCQVGDLLRYERE